VPFAILGLTLWAGAVAAMPAGTVIGVSGSCTDHSHVLRPGDAVQIGDTVDVPCNLKLQMADGSVISIAAGSSMTVANYKIAGFGRHVQLSLAQGLLRAQVASFTGPSTFEVTTAVGTASVGSAAADWFIKAQPDSAQVGVLAGTVDLTSIVTGQSVSLPAHWGTRLETGRAPILPRVWPQVDFNALSRLTECCQSVQPKIEPRSSPNR
jgi:hypothetical protein